MELAVNIISLINLIITLIGAVFLILEHKFTGSVPIKIAKLVVFIALFGLEIPWIILDVSLGKEYVTNIILLILWAFHICVTVLNIATMKFKKTLNEFDSTVTSVATTECIIRDEDGSERIVEATILDDV